MRKTQKGFTLVELIVVITILAILGTIAFISLGSYTADARNAKRTEGVGKLASAVDNGTISGTPIMAFVVTTGSELSNISLAGTGTMNSSGTQSGSYNAGDPNGSALNINEDQFADPQTTDKYKMAVTSLVGGAFQVASILEDAAGNKAKVVGSFNQRTVAASAASGSTTGTNKFKISDLALINYYKAGDEVDLLTASTGTGETATIAGVSTDGQTLTLTADLAFSTVDDIALNADESTGLIASSSSGTLAVTEGGTNLPY